MVAVEPKRLVPLLQQRTVKLDNNRPTGYFAAMTFARS
jgi:hypothetical protein